MGLRSAKATEPPHLGQTLLLRGKTAVVVDAFPGIGRAPGITGSVGGIRYQQRDHHQTD
jgi:hypothetical protein